MTASTTESPVEAADVQAEAGKHPVSRVAVIGMVVSLLALAVSLVGAMGIADIPALSLAAPFLALVGILISAFGISMSHRLQDAVGGTGGYWFALAGLLGGILSILVMLAAQSFAALD